MAGISQELLDALNKAENDALNAKTADETATKSTTQAANDQQNAQAAHATALDSYGVALEAFYKEFGVNPTTPSTPTTDTSDTSETTESTEVSTTEDTESKETTKSKPKTHSKKTK
jgi:hypothetical protein